MLRTLDTTHPAHGVARAGRPCRHTSSLRRRRLAGTLPSPSALGEGMGVRADAGAHDAKTLGKPPQSRPSPPKGVPLFAAQSVCINERGRNRDGRPEAVPIPPPLPSQPCLASGNAAGSETVARRRPPRRSCVVLRCSCVFLSCSYGVPVVIPVPGGLLRVPPPRPSARSTDS
jgi:hypothetical protein